MDMVNFKRFYPATLAAAVLIALKNLAAALW
jgi:hypothetical protein